MAKKLFLLDGMALVYRAHFALIRNPIMTTGGANTSAVYGFANTLLSILEKEKPTHLAVAFDTAEPTARHKIFEAYKAQREAMPEDIADALPLVDRLLEGFGVPVLRYPGYEADDVVGTLARRAEQQGYDTFMVTPDKDFAQLVDEHTFIYKPARQGNGFELLGVPEILEKWGVERVEQVIDILGLWGDASDNIPGIPGIGEKTSKLLVKEFGSVEGLIAGADQLKGKRKENVQTYAEQGLLSKKLVTIDCEVPVEIGLEELVLGERDDEKLKQLFVELEFNSLGQRLFGEGFKAGRGMGGSDDSGLHHQPIQGDLFENALRTIEDTGHDYTLITDEAGRSKLIEALEKTPRFCFDTETTGLDARRAELVGIAFSWEKGTASYVALPEDRDQTLRILEEFRPVLQNDQIEKIGHNLKYDLKVLLWHGVTVAGPFFDTMLAHALVAPDQRHGMDVLAESLLGYSPVAISTLIGNRGEEQTTLRDVPVADVAEYAGEDADITFQLRDKVAPMLDETEQTSIFRDVEIQLLPVLVDVEVAGIRLDTEALAEFSIKLGEQITDLRARIFEAAGTEFNLNSPKQLGEVLFDQMKLEDNPKKTKTGQYQTNEQTLTGLAHKHEIVKWILQYREATKLKGTYVDTLPDAVFEKTGRVHTTFGQLATATGRLVSSNPNLQNIPIRTEQGQEIRKAFIARDDGHVLLSADYSQIELRIMAELSGDAAMLQAFESGLDIHTATAGKVHHLMPDGVTPEMRREAKMINYGLMYGMSTFGLASRLGIPRQEAGEIVEHYFEQFPGIRKYIDDTIAFAREHGYVKTIIGRRRYLRDINSRNATTRNAMERNAVNTPIQGSGADMIKLAMIRIREAFAQEGFRSEMILQIHDELLFDVVHEELDPVKDVVERCMIEALPMKVPIEVEVGVGRSWLEAH